MSARGGGGLQENRVFWTQQAGCTSEHPAVMKACIKPVKDQATTNPIVERGREHEVPSLAEDV